MEQFAWNKLINYIDQVRMGDTLVVHFEDVIEDRDTQLR